VKALAGLPKKARTALLRFLVGLGPLDEITGDGVVKAVLEFGASDGARAASRDAWGAAATSASISGVDDFDIDTLRTLAEAPAEYHGPLLRLLAASRPVGTMSAERLVLEVWSRGHDHWTRDLGPKDIDRITDVVSLGPAFDDVLLRLFQDPLTNRMSTMTNEVEARLASADRGDHKHPAHNEEQSPRDRAA
jgi:hypothetical protein